MGVYTCLLTQRSYYERNRAQDSLLYTDYIIYSPKVPFFRADNRDLLEPPYTASIITASEGRPVYSGTQFVGSSASTR